jgi:post-segregation antitoxin (ccd killing protein)
MAQSIEVRSATVETTKEQLREQLRQLGVNIEALEAHGLKDEALGDLLTGLKGLKAHYEKRAY